MHQHTDAYTLTFLWLHLLQLHQILSWCRLHYTRRTCLSDLHIWLPRGGTSSVCTLHYVCMCYVCVLMDITALKYGFCMHLNVHVCMYVCAWEHMYSLCMHTTHRCLRMYDACRLCTHAYTHAHKQHTHEPVKVGWAWPHTITPYPRMLEIWQESIMASPATTDTQHLSIDGVPPQLGDVASSSPSLTVWERLRPRCMCVCMYVLASCLTICERLHVCTHACIYLQTCIVGIFWNKGIKKQNT